jgi:hypothetical protein
MSMEMPLCFRVGAHGEPDVVGVGGQAGEDLLPVDDEVVAVAHGACLQGGEVGAGFRFGVADGEVGLAFENLRQVEVLLLLAAVLHDGRGDGVDAEHGHGGTGAHRLVEKDELFDRGHAAAAVLLGPADAQPAVFPHLAGDLSDNRSDPFAAANFVLDLGGEQLVVVFPQLLAERLVFATVGEPHLASPLGVPAGCWTATHAVGCRSCFCFHHGPDAGSSRGRRWP